MKKHCNRKHYAKINTLDYVIAGVRPTAQSDLDALHARELSALEAMTHGQAGLQEWWDLHAALNLCETAATLGIGPEALQACKAAQGALVSAARRFESTGRMGLSGEGLVALRHMLQYHHLQRTAIDRKTYEDVIRTSLNRMRSGRVGVAL